ncbi:transposase [Desulfococcaceae bacterium HSG9]|nr:transposase [Desulfococcaceae bacterium HSG9]
MDERIELIERFIKIFSVHKIGCIFGDREFISGKQSAFLLDNGIHFVMRIKVNFRITNARGVSVSAETLFRDLKIGEYKVLKGKRVVNGQSVYVVGTLLPDGEYLILATDKNPVTAFEEYKKRQGVETFFQCLKGRGFNFEDTHMTFPDRIDKQIALPAIAFSQCHLTGEQCASQKTIKIKKHRRKAVSLFRPGLDHLGRILHNISDLYHKFNENLRIILEPLNSINLQDTSLAQMR